MKVSELDGPLLDFWVAQAEGNLTHDSTSPANAVVEHYGIGGEVEGRSPLSSWAPSTEWDSGGPIIERAKIDLHAPPNIDAPDEWCDWAASVNNPGVSYAMQYFGETPLIAAMRAYVASRFGDEVPE
ncbi:phage protein NinX family protein [Burkholderia ubonensis]|uniref:phage protein NinX family protein n=1 Tax=Burkholderia ubonensis TaxID=101571 RepID=UPI0009B35B0C|nr:phage protein NinX family protein [Burkholderia ubonensis]